MHFRAYPPSCQRPKVVVNQVHVITIISSNVQSFSLQLIYKSQKMTIFVAKRRRNHYQNDSQPTQTINT